MKPGGPLVFALQASHAFGAAVAAEAGIVLGAHEERDFPDGEHKARPLESVRERDVYVIQSLHADASRSANDKLLRRVQFHYTPKHAS